MESRKMEGVFSAQKIEHGNIVQEYTAPNKITTGARLLIVDMLATRIKQLTVRNQFGIDRFVLFDINSETASCSDQMLLGSFDCYGDFDPIYFSDITTNTFPCYGSNYLVVDEMSYDLTDEPLDDESIMIPSVTINRISFTVKIGKGYTSVIPRKFALAGLFGYSSDSSNNGLFCYAIEQFPVMVKTEVSTFKFEWTVFI